MADFREISMMPTEGLSPRQLRAIAAILEFDTRAEAAKAAGVGVRSIQRWMAEPAFTDELGRQRSKLLAATQTELVRGSAACARALVAIATGQTKGSTARVQAARAVLDVAQRLGEHVDLARRLDALEAVNTTPPPGGLQ